jgi:aryl-alcohol dehydrogenase-like predicted oxidoreductase
VSARYRHHSNQASTSAKATSSGYPLNFSGDYRAVTVSRDRGRMEYTHLGRTGLSVSRLVLGTMNFGPETSEEDSHAIMDRAHEHGINFFDTANIYGGTKSEEYLGRALGRRRDEVVVATKFGSAVDEQRKGARPEYVRQAAEDSLRRLGTDLYQLHTPDPQVPIEDTLGALDELVRAGKVREIGCSNFSAEQLRATTRRGS